MSLEVDLIFVIAFDLLDSFKVKYYFLESGLAKIEYLSYRFDGYVVLILSRL